MKSHDLREHLASPKMFPKLTLALSFRELSVNDM